MIDYRHRGQADPEKHRWPHGHSPRFLPDLMVIHKKAYT